MNILVAPDKFRGSLEASEVCEAVSQGILEAFPDARVTTVPMADGGEGTAQILTRFMGGQMIVRKTLDPLGRWIESCYGLSLDQKTAFIEMAASSGLSLLSESERNPLYTSSFGTGQLIKDALEAGVDSIILGIGGSATTDGGMGMAAALGYRFFDETGVVLEPVGQNLIRLSRIDNTDLHPMLKNVKITVACDVTNPLYGEHGAAFVYGPQKGADLEAVRQLDLGLRNLAAVAGNFFGSDQSDRPGAGAAGGVGAGASWFLNASLQEGVKIVLEQTNLAERIREADLVITGEGKVDEQTLQGKLIKGLADLCKKEEKDLLVLCGTLQITPLQAKEAGITYATSVLNRPMTLSEAEKEAFERVKEAAFYLVRLYFH